MVKAWIRLYQLLDDQKIEVCGYLVDATVYVTVTQNSSRALEVSKIDIYSPIRFYDPVTEEVIGRAEFDKCNKKFRYEFMDLIEFIAVQKAIASPEDKWNYEQED